MNKPKFDPEFVQISVQEAAEILGITLEELSTLSQADENFPDGFKDPRNWLNPLRFRLADIYRYSEYMMMEAKTSAIDSARPG